MTMAEGRLWQLEVIIEEEGLKRLLRYHHAEETQWTRKGLEDPGKSENLDNP